MIGIVVVSVVACDSSSNEKPKVTQDEAIKLCDREIYDAIANAPTEAEGYTAGMNTMRECMARYNFY